VRAQAERDWLEEMATAAGRADAMSSCALLFDDPEVLNDRLPLLRSITSTEVREAAEGWLLPALHAQVRVLPTRGQVEEQE
jgi:predicted Zn-dependent peptidase